MNFRTVLAAIVLAGSASARTPATPGPEVKKLEFFVGTWAEEGTIPPGPWGAGGKCSITHTNEGMKGNFFLISREGSKHRGTYKMLTPNSYGSKSRFHSTEPAGW